jgi:hypothetical protein
MSTTESLAELITRRDELKINTSADQQRHELAGVVGGITELLHRPYRIESDRLTQKRQELAGELEQAHHERAQLRCRLSAAQGARTATLATGDDAGEHLDLSKALSLDLEAIEEVIGHLEARLRGVDSQHVALTELEGAQMISGISAS